MTDVFVDEGLAASDIVGDKLVMPGCGVTARMADSEQIVVGTWLGRVGEQGRGLVLVDGVDGQIVETADPAGIHSWPSADAFVALCERLAGEFCAKLALTRKVAGYERQIGNIVEIAQREADERDWCSQFDDLMEACGLPRRTRTWLVDVWFSGRVQVEVEADSEDSACEAVDSDDVQIALEWPSGLESLEITEVEVA